MKSDGSKAKEFFSSLCHGAKNHTINYNIRIENLLIQFEKKNLFDGILSDLQTFLLQPNILKRPNICESHNNANQSKFDNTS